jgi:magnesium chelatase family protein
MPSTSYASLDEIKGMDATVDAFRSAVEARKNVLLVGPPGSGTSLLARCAVGLLPSMSLEENIEVSTVYSAAGKLDNYSLMTDRPFRAPHHSVSVAGLVGGGPFMRTGEVTLAHHGVLFLDELAEFRRDTLEALSYVLRDREVRLTRSRGSVVYPANALVIGAMLPCPCGWRGVKPERYQSMNRCLCTEQQVARYRGRIDDFARRHFDVEINL